MLLRTFASLAAAAAVACATPSSRAPSKATGPAPVVAATPAPPDPAALLAEGEAALKANAFARAEALLAEAAALGSTDPRPRALHSLAVFHQARFDEALALARASLERGERYEARLVEGRVSAIRRRPDDALRAFERCAALRPASAEAWSAVSAARLAVGDEDGASSAWANLAGIERRVAAEDRLWTDVLRLPPDAAQVQEALDRCARGTAARLAGSPAKAIHEFRAVVGTVPAFAHCWSELGKAQETLGRGDEAERSYRIALDRYRPDQGALRADTQVMLARNLLARKRAPTEALALVQAARAFRGGRADVVAALALACERTRSPSCGAAAAPGDATSR